MGGQKLAEGIKNSNIKKLYLSCKNIGDDGIAAISSALQDHKTISKKIIEFFIVGTNAKVTEDGIKHIYHMLDSNPSNPKHPSALKLYQQCDKDLLSKQLKLINQYKKPEDIIEL